jgi:rhodanese-related sulfurtransferase
MIAMGFTNSSALRGGVKAWKAAGFPMSRFAE